MKMTIIQNFDTEAIALFDLTLLGQETYLLKKRQATFSFHSIN